MSFFVAFFGTMIAVKFHQDHSLVIPAYGLVMCLYGFWRGSMIR